MPAKAPPVTANIERALRGLGQQLRDRREALGISAVATAEAAGISRVTLHRIEKGEPSVAMSAYHSAISALGLSLELVDRPSRNRRPKLKEAELPKKIRLTDYPQLMRLAWQLNGSKTLSPEEALAIYERNWRHVDLKALDATERKLLEALLAAFGRERLLV